MVIAMFKAEKRADIDTGEYRSAREAGGVHDCA